MNPESQNLPSVCVVVPVFNRLELTKKFLESFSKSGYANYKIVIIDDGSTDGTSEVLSRDYPEVEVLHGDGNLWWTGGTNMGVEYALKHNFDYILTINNDAEVEPGYLGKLVNCASKHQHAVIGSLIMIDGTTRVWSVGASIQWTAPYLFKLNFYDKEISELVSEIPNPYPAQVLNGDGTLFPSRFFREVGLYNYPWFPQYHADSEIILRGRKQGYQAYVCLDARLYNHITGKPLVNNRHDLIFHKKSDKYWRPTLMLYLKYAPLWYKPFFFRQYYTYFKDVPGLNLFGKVADLIRPLYRKLKYGTSNPVVD